MPHDSSRYSSGAGSYRVSGLNRCEGIFPRFDRSARAIFPKPGRVKEARCQARRALGHKNRKNGKSATGALSLAYCEVH